MDQRDSPSWVVVELTSLGEEMVEEGRIEAALRGDLGADESIDIFVPSQRYEGDGKTTSIILMEGYVFVENCFPETTFFALERRPYVSQVLSTAPENGKLRSLCILQNEQISGLKRKLRESTSSVVDEGASVCVVEGPYRTLEGTVFASNEEQAIVYIPLRSIQIMASIPTAFLESRG